MKSGKQSHANWVTVLALLTPMAGTNAYGQAQAEPVVARVQMQFHLDGDVIDVIEKGDLLTVLKDEGDAYHVITFDGHQGLVEKVNALLLAEAVEVYSELIAEHPTEGRYYTLRASAWWARKDAERALADFDQAIELGYREPEAFSSRGMFHAALRNYEQAIADYTRAIEADASDDAPRVNRAAVYMSQQKFDAAIADYDEAIRIRGDSASHFQQRAVAHKLSGELDKAVADFNAALAIDEKFLPAWMGLGFVHYQQGRHQEAVGDFSRAIELNPGSSQAYNNRGYNRQLLGDFENALSDYEKAIELTPEFALAYQNKAWVLSTAPDEVLRDAEAAIVAATKACEINNYEQVSDLKALAAAFAAAGRFDNAIGWQEKAVELAPDAQKPFESEVLERYRDEQPYVASTIIEAEP
jgi:tetratricopeptide (TPR) repeat protein